MEIKRKTNETEIQVSEAAIRQINTGLPMFDHLMDQFVKGLGRPLDIRVKGDLEIDAHHTLEDLGYVVGRYVRLHYEDRQVTRYGDLIQLMDEAVFKGLGRLVRIALASTGDPMSTKGQVEWEVLK
ncbi:hypothetical protein [Fusibacter tunisiensis]|uniref:Imidazoleglycerol phosphate dehydratase HisB n=1 Tax=Fusibacter tunisiensis TaxID=1008308 RepID=A0ABS2MPS3_9FIRM|nr:hypothetical protein [Fusibacter tunisiensis]MBM7561394.1 imidazoleglycerol phosphate dehydratase HisB [Fusibacter tunisiensis]